MTTTTDRKARELRDDVLGVISRFIERRPEVDWTRILEGVWEAAAIVEAAAEFDLGGRDKVGALLPGTHILSSETTPTGIEAQA